MPYIVRNQIKYATGSGSGGGNTNSVDLTMAEYEALEAQGKVSEDTTYYITDASVEGMFSSGIVKLTQAEYDALPESKYSDGVLYAITDGENSGSVGKPVELTREQYEALGDSVLNDNILYAITDGDGLSAKNLAYDASETQFGVNNVQDAIVEQNKNMTNNEIIRTLYNGVCGNESFLPLYENISNFKKIGCLLYSNDGYVVSQVELTVEKFKTTKIALNYYNQNYKYKRIEYVDDTHDKVDTQNSDGHTFEIYGKGVLVN